MKSLILCIVSLSSFLVINTLADENVKFDPKAEQVLINPLGEQLINAIKSNDKKAFLECWVTTDALVAYIATLPKGVPVPKGEQLIAFRKYFDDTRATTSKNFDLIQKDLVSKEIKLSEIQFKSIEVKYEVKHGLRTITTNTIAFTAAGKEYTLWIDDAIKINGVWKFSDKPNAHTTEVKTDKKDNKSQQTNR